MSIPRVAVVIPSLSGSVDALLASVAEQTLPPVEVQVVRGVRPSGRSRNIGARRTSADVIVFVDDDAVLGRSDVLAKLVEPLLSDQRIGVTGTSKLLPAQAPRFQRLVATQVPRIEHPVVAEPVETNPPLDRHGYVEVTATCCAVRRTVLEDAGWFDEQLERGVDTEFFYRVRRLGYRLVLVPAAWVYHPAPRTLGLLLRKHFLYGVGYAQEVRLDRSRAGGRYLRTPVHAAGYLLARTLGLLPHSLLPYSYARPVFRPGLKPVGALASYAAALGYVYGWYRRSTLR